MARRRLRGAAAACAVGAVLVAVGAGAPASAASGSVGAKEWLAEVCAAARTWTRDVERTAARAQEDYAQDALTEGPLAALLTYLDAAADATDTFADAVHDAGVPAVDGGRASARTLSRALDGIEAGFRAARRDLVPLKASSDGTAIAAAVAAARAQVDTAVTDGLATVDEVLDAGPLARAATRVKACRALAG